MISVAPLQTIAQFSVLEKPGAEIFMVASNLAGAGAF
ncbi:hypothetical protein ACVIW2_004039 [Bradyrhizobium huanghuaihaiense]|jgi:hypothetical protein|nr:hypothetical protein [Bradyrhizobium japonicum]MCS3932945.1 hypothetical protein [Bradyrhizobium elkanii]MCP1791018.1 hypothetical protein [Bradyrhizobium japonicum]MCP1803435.1 hypothetical protein [Bradyrhizobium japonicum]MCP1812459.1 hypothetical protein [Bradyrhizobium japonicum]